MDDQVVWVRSEVLLNYIRTGPEQLTCEFRHEMNQI